MTQNAVKVSVLMLAYNQEKYIGEAIAGVVHQRVAFPIELIIADDCSTDGTLQVAQKWRQSYPGIIRIAANKVNLGLARNFIQAWTMARGEYIAICEADDFWIDSTKLQRQADFMDAQKDYSMCFHRVLNYYEKDGSKSLSQGRKARTFSVMDIAMSNPITNVSVFFRRGLFGPLPEWMDQVTSYDFVVHILNACHGKVYYSPRVMAVYRKLSGSIWTGSGKERRAFISRKNRDLLIAALNDTRPDVAQVLKKANAQNCIDLMLWYASRGETDKQPQLRQMIYGYMPGWTDEDIRREAARLKVQSRPKPFYRRMLTATRSLVSRILPLPRISRKA